MRWRTCAPAATPPTLNVGYGHGYSVRQVLESVERVSGRRLTVREEARRAGDPPALVARAERIRSELGWRPRLNDLDTIVRTAYAWEQRLQRSPGERHPPDAPIRYALRERPVECAPMQWGRPKSLSGLMLVGLALMAVPLLVAVLTAVLQIRDLADTGQKIVIQGVTECARQPGPVRADRLARAHGAPLRRAQ